MEPIYKSAFKYTKYVIDNFEDDLDSIDLVGIKGYNHINIREVKIPKLNTALTLVLPDILTMILNLTE